MSGIRTFGAKIGTGVFGVVLYAAMLWAEFGGIFHAFKGHGVGDGLISIFVPPWAWYRSIEFFWHEDPPPSPRPGTARTPDLDAALAVLRVALDAFNRGDAETFEANSAAEIEPSQKEVLRRRPPGSLTLTYVDWVPPFEEDEQRTQLRAVVRIDAGKGPERWSYFAVLRAGQWKLGRFDPIDSDPRVLPTPR